MEATLVSLPTLDALRSYVLQALCARDCLDDQQTPLHQSVISRSGRPCGLFFQVQGPRLLKSYAVWAGPERRILFYDGAGERFAETRLKRGPELKGLAEGKAAKQCRTEAGAAVPSGQNRARRLKPADPKSAAVVRGICPRIGSRTGVTGASKVPPCCTTPYNMNAMRWHTHTDCALAAEGYRRFRCFRPRCISSNRQYLRRGCARIMVHATAQWIIPDPRAAAGRLGAGHHGSP